MSALGVSNLTLGQSSMMDWFLNLNFRGAGTSTISGSSDMVFFWIFLISTFFFVLLMVLMVWFTFKYRRRAGVAPLRSPSHNTVLELSWSVIPTIILEWMFFAGFWGYTNAVMAPADSTELMVTGAQWNWRVDYPNGAASPITTRARRLVNDGPPSAEEARREAATETPIFVVPEDRSIELRMSSIDVIHSFWIPDFRVKFDVFPNRYTSLWFKASKVDWTRVTDSDTTKGGITYPYQDHWVFCAEYCGNDHSQMYAVCRVVPKAQYDQIIKEWAEPRGTPVEQGAMLYKIKGCNSCHSLDGSKGTGPTWKNMYGHSVEFTDGTSRTDQQMTGVEFANYVRESAFTPAAHIVSGFKNEMQIYQGRLTPKELAAIIAFQSSNLLTDRPAPDYKAVMTAEQQKLFEETAAPGATGATGASGATGAPKK
jgi:cytochrome c oxidase subunit 2